MRKGSPRPKALPDEQHRKPHDDNHRGHHTNNDRTAGIAARGVTFPIGRVTSDVQVSGHCTWWRRIKI